jgi:hypothetical protein
MTRRGAGLQAAVLALATLGMIAPPRAALAYPEYQRFIVERSGRAVNCAVCHAHGDGPDGTAPGQIGALTPPEFERLGQARGALEPGVPVNSPILNAFGNHIVTAVGKTVVQELKLAPGELADRLPQDSDLDSDGIPDVVEFVEGTHPLLPGDGRPDRLFMHNLRRHATPIALTLAATLLGLFGLRHLLAGIAAGARRHEDEELPL